MTTLVNVRIYTLLFQKPGMSDKEMSDVNTMQSNCADMLRYEYNATNC